MLGVFNILTADFESAASTNFTTSGRCWCVY